jgi:hypothetical protein
MTLQDPNQSHLCVRSHQTERTRIRHFTIIPNPISRRYRTRILPHWTSRCLTMPFTIADFHLCVAQADRTISLNVRALSRGRAKGWPGLRASTESLNINIVPICIAYAPNLFYDPAQWLLNLMNVSIFSFMKGFKSDGLHKFAAKTR